MSFKNKIEYRKLERVDIKIDTLNKFISQHLMLIFITIVSFVIPAQCLWDYWGLK